MVLSPGHADEEQPALLGHFRHGGLGARPAQRKQAVLAADEKDHRELQALGGVQGQQGDGLGARVQRVDLGAKQHLAAEPRHILAAPLRQRAEQLHRGVDVGPGVFGHGVGNGLGRQAQLIGYRAGAGGDVQHLAHQEVNAGARGKPVVRAFLHRQAAAGQLIEDRVRLRVGAVQHCDVVEADAAGSVAEDAAAVEGMKRGAAEQLVDRARHEGRLRAFITGLVDHDGVGLAVRGRVQPAVGDQCGRCDGADRAVEDVDAAAVVAGQRQHRRARVVLLEAQEESDVGTAEGVDRLVGVADGGEVGPGRGEQPQQPVLELVDVLVFVDGDPPVAAPVFLADCGMVGEQLHRQHDEVVEVDQVLLAQFRQVRRQRRLGFRVAVAAPAHGRELCLHPPRGAFVAGDRGEDLVLAGGIGQAEIGAEAELHVVFPQDPQAE